MKERGTRISKAMPMTKSDYKNVRLCSKQTVTPGTERKVGKVRKKLSKAYV